MAVFTETPKQNGRKMSDTVEFFPTDFQEDWENSLNKSLIFEYVFAIAAEARD